MLALMMVLLPLRGWIGDAMATDMAMTVAAQKMQQTVSTSLREDVHHEHQAHAGHSDHSAHDEGHGDDHSAGHIAGTCESCSACQACHTVALLIGATDLKSDLSALWTLIGAADPFVSAEAALDQKPPIS
ncbi:MAG: hypothetical protein Q7U05_06340 [Polaromonas sp.]|nr:hypothetical protein [Polaromonas sp.]